MFSSLQEGIEVLAQSLGGMTFYLICTILGLVILGMAANEWRQNVKAQELADSALAQLRSGLAD